MRVSLWGRAVGRSPLLFNLGLRRAEIVGLDVKDVAGVAGSGRSSRGPALAIVRKGGRLACLELPAETAAALAGWLALRGSQPGALFYELSPAGRRRRLSGAGLYYIVRTLGERLGVKLWPHGLRHASITAVLRVAADRGMPLPEVLLATGHARSSVGVVLGYYDLLANRQGEIARLVAGTLGAVAARPPRDGLGAGLRPARPLQAVAAESS